MKTKNKFVKIVIILALLSIVAACSPQPQADTAAPNPDFPDSDLVVTFANGTCSLSGSAKLTSGKATVMLNVVDTDKEGYSAAFVTLAPDKTLDDLITASQGPDFKKPYWVNDNLLANTGPASVHTETMSVANGPIYVICSSWNDTLNEPRYMIGYAGPIEVGE